MPVRAIDPVLQAALRLSLSLLFASAALHKLRDLRGFRAALANYRLLPLRAVPAAAALIVAAELWVGAGLLWAGRAVAAAAAALLGLYTAAIAANLARGRREIDCGCGGPARRRPLSVGLVVRNAALIGVAAACALPRSSRALTWLDALTLPAAVGGAALLYGAVDGLLDAAPRSAALRVRP